MKQKFNILIIAALFLIIMPIQFGCDKEELQPQQTEEQAIADEQGSAEESTNEGRTKGWYDGLYAEFEQYASAKYIYDSDKMSEVTSFWQGQQYEIFGDGAYLDLELVTQFWQSRPTMRADAAQIAVYLEHYNEVVAGNKLLLGMELALLLVNVFDIPSNITSAITFLVKKHEAILSISLHACKLADKKGIHCIKFPIDGTDDGACDAGELCDAVSAGLGLSGDYTLPIFGNANEDDFINMQDVTYTELIILEYRDRTELSDAKHDGKINMQDVTQIELITLGKQKEIWILLD